MKKILTGIVGAGLLLNAANCFPESRGHYNIPNPTQESLVNEGLCNNCGRDDIYIKHYDFDKDGTVDMEEAYLCPFPGIVFVSPIRISIKDKNGIIKHYISPKMDEDWKPLQINKIEI